MVVFFLVASCGLIMKFWKHVGDRLKIVEIEKTPCRWVLSIFEQRPASLDEARFLTTTQWPWPCTAALWFPCEVMHCRFDEYDMIARRVVIDMPIHLDAETRKEEALLFGKVYVSIAARARIARAHQALSSLVRVVRC